MNRLLKSGRLSLPVSSRAYSQATHNIFGLRRSPRPYPPKLVPHYLRISRWITLPTQPGPTDLETGIGYPSLDRSEKSDHCRGSALLVLGEDLRAVFFDRIFSHFSSYASQRSIKDYNCNLVCGHPVRCPCYPPSTTREDILCYLSKADDLKCSSEWVHRYVTAPGAVPCPSRGFKHQIRGTGCWDELAAISGPCGSVLVTEVPYAELDSSYRPRICSTHSG